MVDHLHLPAEPLGPHPLIPYVVDANPMNAYDGLGFSSFPERRGFDKDRLLHGDFEGQSNADLNEFFQSWLFFGMLHEVLTTAGEEVDLAEFVETNGKGEPTITTLPLRNYLLRWRERELGSGRSLIWGFLSAFQTPWYERVRAIDDCLVEALDITQRLLSPSTPSSISPARQPAILPEICLSIIILGSTLDTAKDSVVPAYIRDHAMNSFGSDASLGQGILSGDIPYIPHQLSSWGPAAYTVRSLQQNGWCPMEIEMLQELSDAGLYYVSQLRRPQLHIARGHDNCTRRKCLAYQIEDESYRPQHRPGCTGCNEAAVPTTDIANIVMNDKIPLIMVEKRGDLNQFRLHHDDGSDYIAISHVWAHGLGNKSANAVHQCQLNHIWSLVTEKYGSPDAGVVLFWIDTLCVPLAPREAKKMALTRMKDVYRNAHTVFVLDEELQRINCPFPEINTDNATFPGSPDFDIINSNLRELYIRLYVSPWFRRLWTLQEGALAKKLLLRFADGSYPLQDFVRSRYNKALFDNPYQAADTPPMALCRVILDLRDGDPGVLLGRVSPLLCYRDTTEPSDEAICVGGILDLNTSDIVYAGDSPEERMLNLYKQLSQVPVGLLFLDGPKLQNEGFRWAPATLLDMKQRFTQTLEIATNGRIIGLHGGLLVPSWGFLLEKPDGPLKSEIYLEDVWRMKLTPGQENSPMHILETMALASSFSSTLSAFANNNHGSLSSVWHLSCSGMISWKDIPVGNAGFGVIVEQTFIHPSGSGVFKTAVLVSDLAPQVEEIADDGSSLFYEPIEWEYGDELIMQGRFVARVELECIASDEWERMKNDLNPGDTTILTPVVGGIINKWVVR